MSTIMRARENHVWHDLPDTLCSQINAQVIRGTNIVRSSVTKKNYIVLLQQLYSSSEPTLLFNISSYSNFPPPIARHVWKFEIGDSVLLARKVDWTLKQDEKSMFLKQSVIGSYGRTVFRIFLRKLKAASNFFLTPVYSIESDRHGRLSGYFYETEVGGGLSARQLTR